MPVALLIPKLVVIFFLIGVLQTTKPMGTYCFHHDSAMVSADGRGDGEKHIAMGKMGGARGTHDNSSIIKSLCK